MALLSLLLRQKTACCSCCVKSRSTYVELEKTSQQSGFRRCNGSCMCSPLCIHLLATFKGCMTLRARSIFIFIASVAAWLLPVGTGGRLLVVGHPCTHKRIDLPSLLIVRGNEHRLIGAIRVLVQVRERTAPTPQNDHMAVKMWWKALRSLRSLLPRCLESAVHRMPWKPRRSVFSTKLWVDVI